MFRIPSSILDKLYSLDPDSSVVCSSRYEYKLYLDVLVIGDCCYDVVQRKSLSDPTDIKQRLIRSLIL